jgi:hypothetical protein
MMIVKDLAAHVEKPVVGLDYDHTFSASPDAWLAASYSLRLGGYDVVGVTARNRNQLIDDPRYWKACSCIVFCAGEAKKVVLDALGVKVAVWIDDKPETILSHWQSLGEAFDISDLSEDDLRPAIYRGLSL